MLSRLDCSICICIVEIFYLRNMLSHPKILWTVSLFYCVLIHQEHIKGLLKHYFYWCLLFFTEQFIVKMSDSLSLSIVNWCICFVFLTSYYLYMVGIPYNNKKKIPENLHYATNFTKNFVPNPIICKISLLAHNIGCMCHE